MPSLPSLCDIVIASENAAFQDAPHFPNGIVPGDGVHVVWPLVLGPNRGRYFLLTGQKLSAREALAHGLVARVVAREAWLEEAKRVAREIATKGPIAVRLAKEAVDQAFETPLAAGVELERRSFFLARASEDAGEGLKAFLEKRKPDFTGR